MTAQTDKPRSVISGNPLTFEAETCGRCGGSGQYSWNQMHGSRCYGCGGHGVKVTKRGGAAQAFYRESLKVLVSEVQVGQLVYSEPGPMWRGGFFKVAEKTERPDGRVEISGEIDGMRYGLNDFPTSRVRVGWSGAEKAAKRAAALAYQETLTKAGKPRVR